jgi:GH15 family glucan-1,4-alpha-glucosidase
VRVTRRYLHDTLILETELATSDDSAAALIDFMPLRQGRISSHLVRLVVGKRGTVPMRTELIVRFGYGTWIPWVTQSTAGELVAIAGPDLMVLRTPVALRGEGFTTVGDFTVSAGQQVPFEPRRGPLGGAGWTSALTHSKVLAWVAFDRGIKGVEVFGLKGPADRWRRIRAEIHEEVCRRAFNPALGAFAQAYESDQLDASALLIPQVGFLPPSDARVLGSIKAVEQKLLRGGLVLSYDTGATDDGLPPGEGAFIPSSFWLADAFVLTGRLADAQRLFERLVGLCNDVGLLAEEYDGGAQRAIGNFPQAFSHIALADTAYNIAATRKPCEQRSGSPSLAGATDAKDEELLRPSSSKLGGAAE